MKYIAIFIISGAIGFWAGYKMNCSKDKVVSKKVDKTKYKYNIEAIPEAPKTQILTDWYNSPIWINGDLKGNTFYVEAGDSCKSRKAEFKLEIARSNGWRFFAAGAIIGGLAYLGIHHLK